VYHQGGGHCKCVSNTTVTAVKVKPAKQGAAIPYEQVVLNDRPSNYWRLNDLGAVATDIVGGANGNGQGDISVGQSGVLSNDAAATFGGVTGKIIVPHTSLMNAGTKSVSFEVWIKTDSIPTGGAYAQRIVFDTLPPSGSGVGIYSYLYNDGHIWFGAYSVDNTYDVGGPLINLNVYNHIVGVLNRSIGILQVFCNGVGGVASPILSTDDFTADPLANLVIGNANWPTDAEFQPWKGSLDEVAIYPYALSAQQIQKHYQARS
jgi:hypothetical protein